jgi:PleD family two-component response regulator
MPVPDSRYDNSPFYKLLPESRSLKPNTMNKSFKVLILEDNKSDIDLVRRELKKNGLVFTAFIVENRESFENALQDFLPDIILSDFSLPAFDGVTAFNIKQDKSPDVPFIIVSGTIGEERSVEMIRNGVTDYVVKDKLFTLTPKISRALKDAEEVKVKRITDDELKAQYEKLLRVAFLQSHQVRVPIANILGLFNLFEFENPADPINGKVLNMLKLVAQSLDQIVQEIMQNTVEIKRVIE